MDDPELNNYNSTGTETGRNYNTGRGMITGQATDPDSGSKLRESSIDEVGESAAKDIVKPGKSNTFKWFVILVLGIFAIISCYKLAEVVLVKNGTMPEKPAAEIFTAKESPAEDETSSRDTSWSHMLGLSEFGEVWSETDAPYIAMTGTDVVFQWYGQPFDETSDDLPENYQVYVKTKFGDFEQVDCHFKFNSFEMSCVIEIRALMSEPYNLYYGDSVSAKIVGLSYELDELYTTELGTSRDTIRPFITGQIEFGTSNYHPFDSVNGKYPK